MAGIADFHRLAQIEGDFEQSEKYEFYLVLTLLSFDCREYHIFS